MSSTLTIEYIFESLPIVSFLVRKHVLSQGERDCGGGGDGRVVSGPTADPGRIHRGSDFGSQ